MKPVIPKYLKENSKIIIISPAGAVNKDFVDFSYKFLTSLGYNVELSKSCINKHFQFGGTDEERLIDLQTALDNPTIDAILCSRGGYGLIRIIDKLDFSKFVETPKWIIGFSDITNLHIAINKLGIATLHGQMTKAISQTTLSLSVTKMLQVLKGEQIKYKIPSHSLNRNGIARGELIGGNLSIIYSLQATKYEIDTDNKILIIEDLNEYLYHIDRIMINLKLSGKLQKLKALIIGQFSDMKDNATPFGKSVYEIIAEKVQEYNYPLCFDFPVGHIDENMPLVLGANYELHIDNEQVLLTPFF